MTTNATLLADKAIALRTAGLSRLNISLDSLDPDSYRDLVVRISGYSALFTELSERAQEEVIGRMEYEA